MAKPVNGATYAPRKEDVHRQWYVVDAEGIVLGRLASRVAAILRGKHKPQFAPHVDVGDHVIVVNAAKVKLTGQKASKKIYYRHSGYPGGIKAEKLAEAMAKHPERVVEAAVRGMLPKNRLGRRMYKKLHVYAGPDHPHAAQKPQPLDLASAG